MPGIFISYRRDDSEGQAGRLYDDLVHRFGKDAVFMDVTGIRPGVDFRKEIDKSITSCHILLALIGPNWLEARDDAGHRRLDNPLDFVRLETAAALKRDIPVVPVLVHGARIPRAEQLPDDLKDLAYRNAVELTHARWDSDVEVLARDLDEIIKGQSEASQRTFAPDPEPGPIRPEPEPPPRPDPHHLGDEKGDGGVRPIVKWIAAAALAISVVGFGVYQILKPKPVASIGETLVSARLGSITPVASSPTSSEYEYTGNCPVGIQSQWTVQSTLPGKIGYAFRTSLGGSPENGTATIPSANAQVQISRIWTLGVGVPEGSVYRGWIALDVESQNNVSKQVSLTMHCAPARSQGIQQNQQSKQPLVTHPTPQPIEAQAESTANHVEGEVFLAANQTKEGVVTLPSGLQYKVLTIGFGPKPTVNDAVTCNYRGTLINGKEFDSSYKRGQPASFPVSGVIKGWAQALQLMPVGSKWQLFIPPDLAYGDRGAGQVIGPGETVIFEVELLSISKVGE